MRREAQVLCTWGGKKLLQDNTSEARKHREEKEDQEEESEEVAEKGRRNKARGE